MIETTTTDQPVATKRGRNRAVILTDRMCEKRVDERIKIYDRKCQGLFVSITAAGVATFFYKFTDKSIAKQRTAWLGVYNPETFKVEDARSAVYALKGKGSEAIVTNLRQQKVQRETQGKTVNELIKLRVAAMQELELKDDGELRPQVESWSNVASHFRRFVSPRLGKTDRDRSKPGRDRAAVEGHRRWQVRPRRQARQAISLQRPPYAPCRLASLQLGG